MEKVPRVGMGIIVKKEGRVLMILRKGSHGAGTWSVPGGHLEFGENLEDCAIREVFEETGVKINNIRFSTVTNDIFEKEGKHYITLWMVGDWNSGEPQITEPKKCPEVNWFHLDNLPKPMFLPLQNFFGNGFSF